MQTIRKTALRGKWIFAVVAVLAGIWIIQPGTTPEKRVQQRQQDFFTALERREWGRAEGFLADTYADRFGHDRDSAVADLRAVLRQFFAVTIAASDWQQEASGLDQVVAVRLSLSGTGPGLTEFIVAETNRLPGPWVFTWRKTGIWPWSWHIVQVDNEGLNLAAYPGRGG